MSDQTQTYVSLIVTLAGVFHLGNIFGSDNITAFVNAVFVFGGIVVAMYQTYKAHSTIASLKNTIAMSQKQSEPSN